MIKTEEEKRKIYAKISATKRTPEGRKRHAEALRKSKEKWKQTRARNKKPAHNKLPDTAKVKKVCLNCGKEMLVLPCYSETKHFCSRLCVTLYRKGRVHEGYNLNSHHDKGRWGIIGRYQGILFRSLLELSFITKKLKESQSLQSEPFSIVLQDYLQEGEFKAFSIKPSTLYFPDFLVDGTLLVEIKPSNQVSQNLNQAKTLAAQRYCDTRGLKYQLLTEHDIDPQYYYNTMKFVSQSPKEDFVWYKKPTNKRLIKQFNMEGKL